jgi:hypothetical protein
MIEPGSENSVKQSARILFVPDLTQIYGGNHAGKWIREMHL